MSCISFLLFCADTFSCHRAHRESKSPERALGCFPLELRTGQEYTAIPTSAPNHLLAWTRRAFEASRRCTRQVPGTCLLPAPGIERHGALEDFCFGEQVPGAFRLKGTRPCQLASLAGLSSTISFSRPLEGCTDGIRRNRSLQQGTLGGAGPGPRPLFAPLSRPEHRDRSCNSRSYMASSTPFKAKPWPPAWPGAAGSSRPPLACWAQTSPCSISSETQLQRDRETAAHYGLSVRTEQGDMRDLTRFPPRFFDVVWHAHSITFVPDVHTVFTRSGASCAQVGCTPHVVQQSLFCRPGRARLERRRILAPASPMSTAGRDRGPLLVVRQTTAAPCGSRAPREFRHTLSTLINGLAQRGFVLLGLWEGHRRRSERRTRHLGAMNSIAPPFLGFWAPPTRRTDREPGHEIDGLEGWKIGRLKGGKVGYPNSPIPIPQ